MYYNRMNRDYKVKGLIGLIKVTEKAAEQLKKALAQQEKEDAYIRVFVSGMG